MKKQFILEVYAALQGYLPEGKPVQGIENAFADGKLCTELYAQVYNAERRLEERLGVEAYDEDVECIVSCMQDIQDELCYLMYCYGAKFGIREEQK